MIRVAFPQWKHWVSSLEGKQTYTNGFVERQIDVCFFGLFMVDDFKHKLYDDVCFTFDL